jgi:hypothetical protein
MTQHSFFQKSTALVLGLVIAGACTSPVLAVTATPSAKPVKASPSPSVAPPSDAQTTQNLKDRIDSVLKNRADQVKGVLDEMTLKKRGFIGEVERVIEKTVTVKNNKGTEVLSVAPSVVILRDNKKASIDDIAVGDWVIAMGYMTNGDFTLKRLVVSSTTLMPKSYDSVIGTAQTITKTQITLSPRTSAEAITYQINKTTHYENAEGTTLKATDIKKDSQYLIISYTDKNQKIATFVKSLAGS